MTDVNILGINTGCGASVCVLQNGQLQFAIEEERLARVKNIGGFPTLSLAYLKTHFTDFLNQLDAVAVCNLDEVTITYQDLLNRYHRRFSEIKSSPLQKLLKVKSIKNRFHKVSSPSVVALIQQSLSEFNVPDKKFHQVRHHDCHAAAAYYGLAQSLDQPYLVFTLDGGGDQECATISMGHHGELKKLSSTPSGHSIGNLYSLTTYLLGFKPHEHEYKLMGLAPYVPSEAGKKVCNIILEYIGLNEKNNLLFESRTSKKTTDLGLQLKKSFNYIRTDTIACGLQQATETLVLQWIKNGIAQTGIKDILLAGGVFMNIKINQLIANLPEVNSVNVFPSCGDETNSLGAAFKVHANIRQPQVGMLDRFTLGPSSNFDLSSAEKQFADVCHFERIADPNAYIAKLLAQGHIVARCTGAMEFGARALGNRSLLCDPKNPHVVDRINFMIKHRDFWMPFAPAILAEDAFVYLKIPAAAPTTISPYMMFSFDTTDRYEDMSAAIHRADKTARAQIVSKDLYPDLHEIISHFKDLTGRSAILNTSFNLHGYPIVTGTVDAIGVLLNSDLTYLMVDDVLITKK